MARTSVDDEGFTGKTAIITGGGAAGDGVGNGRAAGILLARRGVRVLVVDRQFALAETTVKMIVGEGGEAVALETDVTDEAGCKTMVCASTSIRCSCPRSTPSPPSSRPPVVAP